MALRYLPIERDETGSMRGRLYYGKLGGFHYKTEKSTGKRTLAFSTPKINAVFKNEQIELSSSPQKSSVFSYNIWVSVLKSLTSV